MSRYIDAENAISVLEILADKCADDKAFVQSISVLKDVPTADVVERKDLDKITEVHEKIGYEKGCRDGYAQAKVEAVRCEVCKHYKQSEADPSRKMCWRKDVDGWIVCYDFFPTDYCSYGERREE